MEGTFLMKVILNLIPEDEIEGIWPLAAPLLEKALKYGHGETSLKHLYKDLTNGERKLIMISEGSKTLAAVVLSMHQYPDKKICQVSYLGGQEIERWFDQGFPTVEQVAREAGANAMYIQGRKGWLRKLKGYGYSEYSTLIGKEL
jgi:hypothetical protein